MKKLAQMTSEELAVEYMQGNNRAFDMLLTRTQSDVFSYIIFIVQNEDVANDLFQETFLKVITHLKDRRYIPSGKFNAWIIRIARNTIMDWYRHQKSNRFIDTDGDDILIAEMSDKVIMESSKEDMMTNLQIINDIKHLINSLPEAQRDVVNMRYYQMMSFKEIAEATGCSINTCLGRMRYALINMRHLAKEHNIQLQMAL